MKVLFLVHRVPWPADKGDRLRSYAILRWLARRHEVYMAAYADGTGLEEARAVEEHLAPLCAKILIVPRPPLVRGLRALITGRPICVEVFSSPRIERFVRDVTREHRPEAALAYSSPMAQHLFGLSGIPRVIDLVDVDSEKWRLRARRTFNPVYWLEGRRLRRFEERCVRELDAVTVTSSREADLLGGEDDRVRVVRTGVDLDFFSAREKDPGGAKLGFMGALDYPPNAEGILWFAREVLPRIRQVRPDAELVVVGRRPPDGLERLPGVTVTGWVDDVRPVLKDCAVGVAPILTAHGVQTKALVTMAMGIPLVVTDATVPGIGATPGTHLLAATGAEEFAARTLSLLEDPEARERLARAGRQFACTQCDWERNLAVLGSLLGFQDDPAHHRTGTDPVGGLVP